MHLISYVSDIHDHKLIWREVNPFKTMRFKMLNLWRSSLDKTISFNNPLFVFFFLCLVKTSCIKSVVNLYTFLVCLVPTDPCDFSLCSHPMHFCRVVNGMATCVCRQACPLILLPVCGSDGKSYPNNCSLEVQSCMTGIDITVVSMGECGNCIFSLLIFSWSVKWFLAVD